MRVKIFTTGGSIDKTYSTQTSGFEVGAPQIGRILQEANLLLDYSIEPLMQKDSLELDEGDRRLIFEKVSAASERYILITHGTDTMIAAVVTMNGSNGAADSPFYSPAGRVVLFRVTPGGLRLVSDAPVGAWPHGAAFSDDGNQLLVQSMMKRAVTVFSIEDGNQVRDTGQRIPLKGGGAALRTADKPVR